MQATRHGRTRGFTLVEIMVSLVVFVVAAVGLVAMQKRGTEAQRAALEIREAERVAQEVMAELQAASFEGLIAKDFQGNDNAALTYTDDGVENNELVGAVRDYGAMPFDEEVEGTLTQPGRRTEFFRVVRTVEVVTDPTGVVVPSTSDPGSIDALRLEVQVLWIDTTNSVMPPPEGLITEDLTLDHVDPDDPEFEASVARVRVQTVRVNDGSPL